MLNRQWVSAAGITEDDVDALVLNLRLLIQDRDGLSIRCLADNVYSQATVRSELKDRFRNARDKWVRHRGRPSCFGHFSEDRNFTNGELFEIILYGGLAHVNRDKVASFRRLTSQGAYSSVLFAWFLDSLKLLLDVLRAIRQVNVDLLREAGGQGDT
jgi:hypothetical protein